MCAGVINNLEVLAWIPWLLVAGLVSKEKIVPVAALFTALAWLAGEPVLWALGLAAAFTIARAKRRFAVGVALGVIAVLVQMIPFTAWIVEGDRGFSTFVKAELGTFSPLQLWGLVSPAIPRLTAKSMVYIETIFLGAPLLTLAALGLRGRRRLVVVLLALSVLSILPAVGAGKLFLLLTGGLVRYPSRFALVATLALIPFIGLGVEAWKRGSGNVVGLVLGGLAVAGCFALPTPWHWLVAGIPAVVLLSACLWPQISWLRNGVIIVGLAGAALASWPILDLQPWALVAPQPSAWPEVGTGERLYTPTTSEKTVRWLASSPPARRIWLVGYLNLHTPCELVRTYGPLSNKRLAEHLRETDRGAEARWWLDMLGGRWTVMPNSVLLADFVPVRQRAGLWLSTNLRSLPSVSVANATPEPERPWVGVGAAIGLRRSPDGISAFITNDRRGYCWVSVAPVQGWKWTLDGERIDLEQGPGILQYLSLNPGQHRLEGTYRPPGLAVLIWISSLAAVGMMLMLTRGFKKDKLKKSAQAEEG
jgi:hypothetical protein